jgi:hypothetical protein
VYPVGYPGVLGLGKINHHSHPNIYQEFKKSQSFIEIRCHWLNNLEFVERIISFVFV